MRRKDRTITTWALIVVVACSAFSAGCEPTNWFRSNFNLNVVVPLGLGGTPGLLNPFGIVQAWVNAMLGAGAADGGGGTEGGTDGDTGGVPVETPAPPTHVDPSIGVILE